MSARGRHEDSESPTSIHIQRAITGDAASLDWIVVRFSPVLLVQARFRLGTALRRFYDPEDLVADVWGVVLRRLAELRVAAESNTGTLIRYLGTVLLRRIRDVARLAAVRRSGEFDSAERQSVSQLDASTTSIVTRAIRDEQGAILLRAVEDLEPLDRQVVVLRGFEGASLEEVAAIMNTTRSAVSTRYHRALKKLKEAFPDSVLAELAED